MCDVRACMHAGGQVRVGGWVWVHVWAQTQACVCGCGHVGVGACACACACVCVCVCAHMCVLPKVIFQLHMINGY